MTMTPINEKLLDSLRHKMAYWQRKLGLLDWDLRLEWAGAELAVEGATAQYECRLSEQVATISILHPDARYSSPFREYNVEADMVHELLHLVLIFHDPHEKSNSQTLFEQALNKIAKALTQLVLSERSDTKTNSKLSSESKG